MIKAATMASERAGTDSEAAVIHDVALLDEQTGV